MQGFYEAVRRADFQRRTWALTVIDGDAAGQKALWCGGEFLWEPKGGFCIQNQSAIEAVLKGEGDAKQSLLPEGSVITAGGCNIYCEQLRGEAHLVICGGGHVSLPVIQIGRMLGFRVTVLEDRLKFADDARRVGASLVLCMPFEQGLSEIAGDDDTFFVIVTRGHRYDQVCLEHIIGKKHAYIGMIGSRKRAAMVKAAVAEKRGDTQALANVYSPIGLDIGAKTPEEIGIAILAQVIQVKNQKKHGAGYSKELLEAILEPETAETGQVLATIIRRKGSAPRGTGTKMLIRRNGTCVGTIGGGCVEAEIVTQARGMMQESTDKVKLCHMDMTGADAQEEGMVCGGMVDVLLERIP